jgi:hypothetical protein
MDGAKETFEVLGFSEGVGWFVEFATKLADSEENIKGHESEDHQGSHLRCEADHHDAIASASARSLGCNGGSSTD